MYLLFKWLLRY